jgi:transposase
MAAKTVVKSKTSHGDDYITKGEEFRYLFKFLRQYYEFFLAFNKVDAGQDQRVDKSEFEQAAPMLKKWGIDTTNMDQQWKEADVDGKG